MITFNFAPSFWNEIIVLLVYGIVGFFLIDILDIYDEMKLKPESVLNLVFLIPVVLIMDSVAIKYSPVVNKLHFIYWVIFASLSVIYVAYMVNVYRRKHFQNIYLKVRVVIFIITGLVFLMNFMFIIKLFGSLYAVVPALLGFILAVLFFDSAGDFIPDPWAGIVILFFPVIGIISIIYQFWSVILDFLKSVGLWIASVFMDFIHIHIAGYFLWLIVIGIIFFLFFTVFIVKKVKKYLKRIKEEEEEKINEEREKKLSKERREKEREREQKLSEERKNLSIKIKQQQLFTKDVARALEILHLSLKDKTRICLKFDLMDILQISHVKKQIVWNKVELEVIFELFSEVIQKNMNDEELKIVIEKVLDLSVQIEFLYNYKGYEALVGNVAYRQLIKEIL